MQITPDARRLADRCVADAHTAISIIKAKALMEPTDRNLTALGRAVIDLDTYEAIRGLVHTAATEAEDYDPDEWEPCTGDYCGGSDTCGCPDERTPEATPPVVADGIVARTEDAERVTVASLRHGDLVAFVGPGQALARFDRVANILVDRDRVKTHRRVDLGDAGTVTAAVQSVVWRLPADAVR